MEESIWTVVISVGALGFAAAIIWLTAPTWLRSSGCG